jgi:hypothetical protein
MTCTHQEPLGSHLGVSSKSELAEAGGVFDLPDDRLHDCLSSGIQSPAFQGSDLPPHLLLHREAVRYPTPWERIIIETVLFSAASIEIVFGFK